MFKNQKLPSKRQTSLNIFFTLKHKVIPNPPKNKKSLMKAQFTLQSIILPQLTEMDQSFLSKPSRIFSQSSKKDILSYKHSKVDSSITPSIQLQKNQSMMIYEPTQFNESPKRKHMRNYTMNSSPMNQSKKTEISILNKKRTSQNCQMEGYCEDPVYLDTLAIRANQQKPYFQHVLPKRLKNLQHKQISLEKRESQYISSIKYSLDVMNTVTDQFQPTTRRFCGLKVNTAIDEKGDQLFARHNNIKQRDLQPLFQSTFYLKLRDKRLQQND